MDREARHGPPPRAVTSLARFEFAVPRTIARVKNPRNAGMFTPETGVDVALRELVEGEDHVA